MTANVISDCDARAQPDLRDPDVIAGQVRLHSDAAGVVSIRDLRFPVSLSIEVTAGHCIVSQRGFARTLRSRVARVVPALEPVSLVLIDSVTLALIQIDALPIPKAPGGFAGLGDRADWVADDARERKPLTAALSLAVFMAPHADWRLATACRPLGLDETGTVSRRLLCEGESFREIVMTYRLTRLALDLMATGSMQVPAFYGFRDRCHLENAVYDRFGLPVSALARLASTGIA
ncbi:hypothetical protein P3W85_44330 [Cupriavidus basilensis]|uniref:AraC family transcriptional regulator n=1 Tax=Cupriavidus basilensis TaxID=68895 RepID=A0ABT6B5U5_9BURK|nr:hypothetical protein [Cupriavidus basilensis]MDF3839907.1 hypothetical protein [Cupriavidus basilensis]